MSSRINVTDCMAAAKIILAEPNVLIPESFTTEPTGGIHVPLLVHHGSCYLMVDTHLDYSASDTFSLLKVVYFASKMLQRCALGGVASTSKGRKGFFVSITASDPRPLDDILSGLLNRTSPNLGVGR